MSTPPHAAIPATTLGSALAGAVAIAFRGFALGNAHCLEFVFLLATVAQQGTEPAADETALGLLADRLDLGRVDGMVAFDRHRGGALRGDAAHGRYVGVGGGGLGAGMRQRRRFRFGDQAVGEDRARLTDAVRAIDGLRLDGRFAYEEAQGAVTAANCCGFSSAA